MDWLIKSSQIGPARLSRKCRQPKRNSPERQKKSVQLNLDRSSLIACVWADATRQLAAHCHLHTHIRHLATPLFIGICSRRVLRHLEQPRCRSAFLSLCGLQCQLSLYWCCSILTKSNELHRNHRPIRASLLVQVFNMFTN